VDALLLCCAAFPLLYNSLCQVSGMTQLCLWLPASQYLQR
jgi:hypothetical protein